MLMGTRINDRYKLISPIGGGGMANVFLAQDVILNRHVAVKILRVDLTSESNLIRRFQREAQSATSLVHPNIVSIYDVGEENDLHYIVMEYVEGMDLKQYIQENAPISFEKIVNIMLQIVSAVKVAHKHHIIHRDLKPQNILIDHDGVVKITDFGIAMALSKTSITQTNSVVGSVHYLSPEQARGGMTTQKSDIYSLGIVLYELLTGKVPYDGESAVSIAIKHLQASIPSVRIHNSNIPQSLENIITKATAKDPLMRYPSAEAMEEDLRTCLKEERLNEPKYVATTSESDTKIMPVMAEGSNISNLKKDGPLLVHEDTNQKKKPPRPSSKKKKVFWITFFTSLFFVAILLGLWVLGKSPKEIEIPNVVGKTEAQAVSALQKQGFAIGEIIERNSDVVKEGKVIETSPKVGELKEAGTKVDLYVSIGSKKITMESFVGRDYSETKKLLKERGFNSVEKTEKYSDAISEGMIISQNPAAGESLVAKETDVAFVVSKGPAPIKLKDLEGYNRRALDDYASSTGLVIKVTEENSDDVEKGQVIRQSPEQGAKISKGSTVNVVISLGPKEKEVKKVTKTFHIKYEPKEEEQSKSRHVQIYIEDKNHSMTSAFKEMDITKDEKVSVTFEIEEGSKGGYKIIIDNTVVNEGTIS